MKRKAEDDETSPDTIDTSLPDVLDEELLDADEIEKDIESFTKCYDTFIDKMKKSLDSSSKLDVVELGSELLTFKELNRKSQFRLSKSREQTKETKDNINQSHLIMQNMLYEALHLQKATVDCLDYKCLHEELDLIPIDQFNIEAPEKYKTAKNEHELMLNRLYLELDERKRLADEIEKAENVERALNEEIQYKMKAYNDVGKNLSLIFEATQPLEDVLGIPMHESDEHSEAIKNLDHPLYIVYLQLQNASTNFEMSIDVKDDAVIATIQVDKDLVAYLNLKFQYYLEYIHVEPSIQFDNSLSETMDSLSYISKELLSTANLRQDLFEEPENVINFTDPVQWCQEIAGLFENYKKLTKSKSLVAPSIIENLQKVRDRVSKRLLLAYHIHYNIDCNSKTNGTYLTFSDWKLVNRDVLNSIAPNVAYRFCKASRDGDQINYGFYMTALVDPPPISKKANITAGPLRVWILIPDSYPDENASFAISLDDSDMLKVHPNFLDIIQLVEMETNCFCDELKLEDDAPKECSILSRQINRMCVAVSMFWKQMDLINRSNSLSTSNLSLPGKFPTSNRPFNTNTN